MRHGYLSQSNRKDDSFISLLRKRSSLPEKYESVLLHMKEIDRNEGIKATSVISARLHLNIT
jgi:hypothetical protein